MGTKRTFRPQIGRLCMFPAKKSAIEISENHVFLAFFWLIWHFFFKKNNFSPQMTKNGFWGLFLFPKTVFMQFLAILGNFKFWIFYRHWRSKMHIFDHFGALLNFFFQNFVLPTNCQETIKTWFCWLFSCPKIIFMQFWAIYDDSKILNFWKIFEWKMHFFSLLRGHFELFADFFSKIIFSSKNSQKWEKMLVWCFSRS